jgi:photosystem II stability/assembly factor-like uncharacterized protein
MKKKMNRSAARGKSKATHLKARRKTPAKASKRTTSTAKRIRATAKKHVMLMVGTRKGAFIYHGDPARSRWRLDGPHRLGEIVNHVVLDPRDGKTMLMAARAGHLGPTIFRSTDMGRTWKEAAQPPAFSRAENGANARAVEYTFWLSPAHRDERDVWYAGTCPPAMFRSDDGGVTWRGIDGYNDHPMYLKWNPSGGGTPDGPVLSSVNVDPRDAKHIYMVTSDGGAFETFDRGGSWRSLNKGVEANFLPDPYPEYGQDVHCLALHPAMPDRLYQQNHCGIYRVDRPDENWIRIGNNMPKQIGDIGFGIVVHPRDPDTAWVFPMDGTTVWPRTSPDGKPALYRTSDAGATWARQDRGLPRENAWFTVKRQAFCADDIEPVGVYFGTTSGEVWMSPNEGRSFSLVAAHLPHIYSVVAATID